MSMNFLQNWKSQAVSGEGFGYDLKGPSMSRAVLVWIHILIMQSLLEEKTAVWIFSH